MATDWPTGHEGLSQHRRGARSRDAPAHRPTAAIDRRRFGRAGGVSAVALIFVGLLLVPLGILAGGSLAMMVLGVVCLVAACALEVAAQRRRP